MPSYRTDPTTGRWVVIAENRTQRPDDFRATSDEGNGDDREPSEPVCPFCAGNESETPREKAAIRDRSGNWRVRVVSNKYPAVTDERFEPIKLNPFSGNGSNITKDNSPGEFAGFGVHEVVIDSPDHVASISQLTPDHLADVMRMYRQRLLDLRNDPRLQYGLIFKNVGAAAGASLEHTHSQLVATPIVPTRIVEELSHADRYHQKHGSCVYCDMIQRELDENARIVAHNEHFIALCPFAARFPFETWILPLNHASHFEALNIDTAGNLANLLHDTIRRIELIMAVARTSPDLLISWCEDNPRNPPNPPESQSFTPPPLKIDLSSLNIDQSILTQSAYNFIIHTAPFRPEALEHFHWHIEILPSMVRPAGFEWGSGIHINPVSPESAAKCLRAIM